MCGHHVHHRLDHRLAARHAPRDRETAFRARAPEPSWAARPDLRASDAEREEVVQLLREHAAQGRLGVEELDERLGRAYAARTRGELLALLADLPAPERRVPPAVPRRHGHKDLGAHLRTYVLVSLLLVVIWLATGAGAFWPAWAILGWGLWLVPHALASAARGGRSRSGAPRASV